MLDYIPESGLTLNAELEPSLALLLPLNGGVTFPLPWGVRSAIATGLATGIDGTVPKDIVEFVLFGNDFEQERLEQKQASGGYDVARWDGSAWAIGSLGWALARAWMPAALQPYLSEFSVGVTLKITGGAYGEIKRSDGGFVARRQGVDMDMNSVTQSAGGWGFGLDFGVAGVGGNGRTTFSVGLLNLLDAFSWNIRARQDSLFATGSDLLASQMFSADVSGIEDILDNPDVDGDGKADFHKKIGERALSRSLPAILRMGLAHRLNSRLVLAANWDQAFSEGFGLRTRPRLSAGGQYLLKSWFPAHFGLSVGGRRGLSASVGWGLGPFTIGHLQLRLLDTALVTRRGFVPGLSKGTAISLMLIRLYFI